MGVVSRLERRGSGLVVDTVVARIPKPILVRQQLAYITFRLRSGEVLHEVNAP